MVEQTRRGWHAVRVAVVGVLAGLGPAALAQQPQAPNRTVTVRPVAGRPGVYQATGTMAAEALPAIPQASQATPAVPGPGLTPLPPIPGAPQPAVPPPGPMTRAPGPYPMAAGGAHPMAAEPVGAGCATCGRGGKHGPTSIFRCLCTPATVPPPLGANMRNAFDMQRANALTEYFVLYREDWLNGSNALNTTGARHLDGIVRRFGMIPAAVRVEPTGVPALDEGRRAAVAELLVQAGVPAEEAVNRVVIGASRAEGLRYTDIEGVYGRSIGTYGGGAGVGGNYGGFGGGYGGFGGGIR